MQVLNPNNVKIYNLSSGKSVPQWLSERKRRMLQKKNVEIRRRIQLIQDFEMPGLSSNVKVTNDGQYILATGIYKPRIRCYDVYNLSLKFERCFNSEAVQFLPLSDDYSKIALLLCDRYVELHAKRGYWARLRIPRVGRDLVHIKSTADLYMVGSSSEIYRLNLDQGQFLRPLETKACTINKICANPVHELVICGTSEGRLEAWDPRDPSGCLREVDCAINAVTEQTMPYLNKLPGITSLSFKDSLNLAVGTSTGQVLLYDIRAYKPYIIKDHKYELPIRSVNFIGSEDLVASMDKKSVKFWKQNTGESYTVIPAPVDLNDMCIVPDTGVLFLANEAEKILTYFIPSIGPAPKWCSFLDNLTEELEESMIDTVYDDYKFVTQTELEDLGLGHLAGTNLLRAYMHGYFMDIRLYNKAKTIVQPSAFTDLKKKKIKEKVELERKARVLKPLPAVNKALAERLQQGTAVESNQKDVSLLNDERFQLIFEDPEFEIDETTAEYNNVKPLLAKLEKNQDKNKKKIISAESCKDDSNDEESDNEDSSMLSSSSSSDEEQNEESNTVTEDIRPQTAPLYVKNAKRPKLYEIKDTDNTPLLEKLQRNPVASKPVPQKMLKKDTKGAKNQVESMKMKTPYQTPTERYQAHMKERALYRRSAKHLK